MNQTSSMEAIKIRTDRPYFALFLPAAVPTSFPYTKEDYRAEGFALLFGALACVAFVANISLFTYIIWHKLYQNFVSSQFIAHLCCTNMLGLSVLIPMFSLTLWTGGNLWEDNPYMCRTQAFLTVSIWSVVHYMSLCIAGVHLLTFARIHYDQLFGLSPKWLCFLSWLVACAVAFPCYTNGHIVVYDPILRYCIWGKSDSSYKFLAYLIILGLIIPSMFSYYAYFKVLGILYHSPIVFQSIGLYKSRFLVYAFLLAPFYQVPFFIVYSVGTARFEPSSFIPYLTIFIGYIQLLVSPLLYGLSLVMMKEEDMALTARAHLNKNATTNAAYHPITPGHNL